MTFRFILQSLALLSVFSCSPWSGSEVELDFHPGVTGRFIAYVSSASGSDSSPGTAPSPVKTIGRAIALGNQTGGQFRVRVAEGTYTESLRIENTNAIVEGGYNSTFSERDRAHFVSRIIPSDTTSTQNFTIRVESSELIVSGFTIENVDGFTGEFSAGLAAGTSVLTLTENTFIVQPGTYSLGVFAAQTNTGLTIRGNTFTLEDGVFGAGVGSETPGAVISENTFQGANLANQSSGVVLHGDGTIANNIFDLSGNILYGINTQDGEGEFPSQSVTIAGNTLRVSGDSAVGIITGGAFRSDTIENNVFEMLGGAIGAILLEQTSGSARVRHNTLTGSADAGVVVGDTAPTFAFESTNNLFSGQTVCILEYPGTVFAGSATIKNNNLNCTVAYYDVQLGCGGFATCTLTQMQALASVSASGNINEAAVFSDAANRDFTLAPSCPVNIREGGLDGSVLGWDSLVDKNGAVRTGNGAAGWSMGAYESSP